MRAKQARRLYRQARKEVGKESTLIQHPNGQQVWQGHRRRYKDLKKEFKRGLNVAW